MITKMSRSSMSSKSWYRSMLAGNDAYSPSAYELISSQIVTTTAASITFSSIPNTYKHLQIRFVGRTNRALELDGFDMRINSDTGSNYSSHRIYGTGSTVGASGAGSQNRIVDAGVISGNNAASGIFGSGIVDILDYTSSKNKTLRNATGVHSVAYNYVTFSSGAWYSSSAITSVSLLPQVGTAFVTGSRFSLYGIKG